MAKIHGVFHLQRIDGEKNYFLPKVTLSPGEISQMRSLKCLLISNVGLRIEKTSPTKKESLIVSGGKTHSIRQYDRDE